MNSSTSFPSPNRSDKEYSFLEALSLGPASDQFTLVSQEKLGLAPPAVLKKSTPAATVKPLPSSPAGSDQIRLNQSPLYQAPLHQSPLYQAPLHQSPLYQAPLHQSPQYHYTPQIRRAQTIRKPPPAPPAPPVMDTSKSQAQCLDVCGKTTEIGDRISVRLLEYLTSVKQSHLPPGLDALAHGFLSTCQVLWTLQAGLQECSRTGQYFPWDLLAELEKKFRVCQADFNMLDHMLAKGLETERKGHGAMGRMKRGLSKLFGDIDFTRMTAALEQTRESLSMSALMFQWSLGNEKIESGMGIGFTGLAAALNRLDQKKGGDFRDKSLDAGRSHHNLIHSRQHDQPPLPPVPSWAERTSSINHSQNSQHSQPSRHSHHEVTPDARPNLSELRQWTATSPSSISSHERHGHNGGPLDHLSALSETLSQHTASDTPHEGMIEEIAALDLGTTKGTPVHMAADPSTVPRWTPRSSSGAEAANLKGNLVPAIRAKNHKLVEQLLDRGVSPIGPDSNALIEAAGVRDHESLRLLLCFGADPNERDREGMTPLAAAVDRPFLSGAVTLLKYGADPNMKAGLDQDTPVAHAAFHNRLELTHLLLMYGSEANQINSNGDTLLISAINKKAPLKLIEIILEYGADPNGKSSEGKTALFEAINSSRVDIVTCLLEHGANPNLPGPKHMLWPATYKAPCLKVLLEHGADPKKCPGIMELAASVNNIESVRILLKAGVDPNAKKDGVYTPLCTSIRDNRPDIFQMLLSNGANPNVPASEYPAFKCITHQRLGFLPQLVAAGADLNNPKGILETAVSFNYMEAVLWLLEHGIDPNERSPKGHSPLTSAIRDKRSEMVDLLIMRGADPNKRGEDWPLCMAVHTPAILRRVLSVLAEPRAFKGVIERAVAANQIESVKLLLSAGVSVEDKNGGVFSPLTTAIREDRHEIVKFLVDPNGGHADVNAPGEHLPIVKALRHYNGEDTSTIELLLDRGADPNKMYRGWNAMFQAVENGDTDILKLLMDKSGGVDLDARDEMGHTVLEMAIQRGWDEGVKLLRDAKRRR